MSNIRVLEAELSHSHLNKGVLSGCVSMAPAIVRAELRTLHSVISTLRRAFRRPPWLTSRALAKVGIKVYY
jgi:hypothetical protein